MTSENAQKILTDTGLRNTADRRALLQLFDEQRAWTVAQLHNRLLRADLSTIYRNVSQLTNKGLLCEAEVRGKETYYELTGRDHHAHSICQHCGLATCVPCPLKNQSKQHALEFYSTCDRCHLSNPT
ncbi:transcriptional repressor [Patescibacteria group bacterium]|nr:transcriptional repressor [Patescibacteria group bacterium]MBU1029438.1 transcriptional repressor [Patescibacteria group bacterium]MBU1916262.1 transcriptional repressor [Patescibacteria group bacterium]